jgi:hypothetical protein
LLCSGPDCVITRSSRSDAVVDVVDVAFDALLDSSIVVVGVIGIPETQNRDRNVSVESLVSHLTVSSSVDHFPSAGVLISIRSTASNHFDNHHELFCRQARRR